MENLALRQQLAILQRQQTRPRIHNRDRLFWVIIAKFWRGWRKCLMIVQPETVVRWHRLGFKLFWRYKSNSGKGGRPKIDREIRALIIKMAEENRKR